MHPFSPYTTCILGQTLVIILPGKLHQAKESMVVQEQAQAAKQYPEASVFPRAQPLCQASRVPSPSK